MTKSGKKLSIKQNFAQQEEKKTLSKTRNQAERKSGRSDDCKTTVVVYFVLFHPCVRFFSEQIQNGEKIFLCFRKTLKT